MSSVYTFPRYRRTGLGGRVVRRAPAEIEQAGDGDIALLFTYEALEPFYRRCGWQVMPGTGCLIGERARPVVHDAVATMLFLAAKGCQHRSAFEHARVYVGCDPW